MIVIAMITTSITTVIVMSITGILLISAACSNKDYSDYAIMICEYNYRDNVTRKKRKRKHGKQIRGDRGGN